MAEVTMRVLTEPLAQNVRVVVSFYGDLRPVLSGGGRTTLVCGSCGLPIGHRVDAGSIGAVALQCPRCCAYNALAVA